MTSKVIKGQEKIKSFWPRKIQTTMSGDNTIYSLCLYHTAFSKK